MRQQLKQSLVKGWRLAAPEVDLDHAKVNSLLEKPERFPTEGTYCKNPPNTDAPIKCNCKVNAVIKRNRINPCPYHKKLSFQA